jgi:hypothetical protein
MPNPRAGGPPLVGCPRLLIEYIRSYPPYLEGVSSIRNLSMCHAVVTRDPPNLDIVPSLWLFVPNCLQAYHNFFFSGQCGQNFREWLVLLHLWLLSCVQSLLSYGQWSVPPQCFDNHFSNPDRRPDCLLHDLQPYSLPEGLVEYSPATQM